MFRAVPKSYDGGFVNNNVSVSHRPFSALSSKSFGRAVVRDIFSAQLPVPDETTAVRSSRGRASCNGHADFDIPDVRLIVTFRREYPRRPTARSGNDLPCQRYVRRRLNEARASDPKPSAARKTFVIDWKPVEWFVEYARRTVVQDEFDGARSL